LYPFTILCITNPRFQGQATRQLLADGVAVGMRVRSHRVMQKLRGSCHIHTTAAQRKLCHSMI
jgi:hypothetical protein